MYCLLSNCGFILTVFLGTYTVYGLALGYKGTFIPIHTYTRVSLGYNI